MTREEAANLIQVRARYAQQRRHQEEQAEMQAGAITVQSAWRAKMVRLERDDELQAVVHIQRRIRGRQAAAAVGRARADFFHDRLEFIDTTLNGFTAMRERLRGEAATSIQRWWRSMRLRHMFLNATKQLREVLRKHLRRKQQSGKSHGVHTLRRSTTRTEHSSSRKLFPSRISKS